jgi:hypothetical protein
MYPAQTSGTALKIHFKLKQTRAQLRLGVTVATVPRHPLAIFDLPQRPVKQRPQRLLNVSFNSSLNPTLSLIILRKYISMWQGLPMECNSCMYFTSVGREGREISLLL